MNFLMLQVMAAANVTGMELGERVMYALRMLIVGIGAVFAILALLWGVLVLARILLHDLPNRSQAEQDALKSAPPPGRPNVSPRPTVQVKPVDSAPAAQDNGVLIAIITAAVSAAMSEEGTLPPGGFRVVSFRRSSDVGAWNRK